jgi:hypothetical protein
VLVDHLRGGPFRAASGYSLKLSGRVFTHMTLPVEQLATEAGEWPGIETAPHRFGGTEFRLGDREVGHVHRAGLLDINFTRPLRNALVAEGRADEHRVVPDSGWVSYELRTPEALADARWLLRLSYLHAVLVARRRPEGQAVLATLDPAAELDALEPSDAVRSAFDRLLLVAREPADRAPDRSRAE